MRQRKSNLFSRSSSLSESNHLDDDDSSDSDPEDGIQAVPPDEEKLKRTSPRKISSGAFREDSSTSEGDTFLGQFRKGLLEGKVWWAQCTSIAISSLLTYSFHLVGASVNVQIAIMAVITLVGASPFCSGHLLTASIGTFVGGQNIIGATGLNSAGGAIDFSFVNYLWLLVLAVSVGLVWSFFVTHPKIKLLDGYSGRLGTTTFLGMNLVMICLWGPLGVVDWNRYYYGLVHIVHVAEEDSTANKWANVWTWTQEVELAIGYFLSVLWIGVITGVTRLRHNDYVQQWHKEEKEAERALEELALSSSLQPLPKPKEPTPLNNVVIPVLWALFSILVVNATGYQHAPGLYNGFAVGAYVGMASLQKIPSVTKFATVSAVAAIWGLTLTPFFVGFAGKSGFTSMMGHVTHETLERFLKKLWRQQRLRQHEEQEQQRLQEEQRQRLQEEQEKARQEKVQEEQRKAELQQQHEQKQQQQQQQGPQEPYHPPHKPSRKLEHVFLTKQQRRQQQRLLQQQRQQQQQKQPKEPSQDSSNTEEMAPLRHRAWVTTPADGVHWEHPQLNQHDSETKPDGV
jgi:cell division protein FtsN